MFGILRTTLALMVMVYHLFVEMLPLGTYAVFGFYVVSGYLMTLIMQESYGYSWAGRRAFAVNRCLRLYPQYWAAAGLSLLLILILGAETIGGFHKKIFVPTNVWEWGSNLSMIFPAWHPIRSTPRLVPPTWALTVEIFFYFLICLGLSKTSRRVKVWFLLSLAYVGWSLWAGLPSSDRYFPVVAASLPFSLGAGIYFLSRAGRLETFFSKHRLSSAVLFLAVLANCLLWVVLSKVDVGRVVEVGFYINLCLCFLLVCRIVSGDEILQISRKWDQWIGNFSYPVYLLHWQSGLIATYLIFGEPLHGFSFRGFIGFAAALVVVAALSLLFVAAIDEPIQRTRARIKARL